MSPLIKAAAMLGMSCICSSFAHAQLQSAKFGFIAPVETRLELVEERSTVPWKKGTCEPWFGIYLEFSPSQEHAVEFRAYSEDRVSGEYREVQKDPVWFVVDAAILSAENIDFVPGNYRFTATIDRGDPLAFDFKVTRFAEESGESCPGPTRQEAKEIVRSRRGD
ncbi:MAG: hypothetical protein R3F18_18685 [Lysobacterales bacterium]|nr:hypothetical protein [Xanthomonadales bacterium]